MNYDYDPQVAAKLAAYVNYIWPVQGAKEVLQQDRPEAREQPADLPRRRDAGQAAPVPTLSPADERELTARMPKVTGA